MGKGNPLPVSSSLGPRASAYACPCHPTRKNAPFLSMLAVAKQHFSGIMPGSNLSRKKGSAMAEDVVQQPEGQQQGVQVLLDERELKTTYTNAYRIHTAPEEVVIDLGFNMANPNNQGQSQQQLLFKVTDRVIMTYVNAKRLAMSLGQLIKRYEQQFGELPLQPGQRK